MATDLYYILQKTGKDIEEVTLEELIERALYEVELARKEFHKELVKDLHLLFDKCIDQFYRYKTKKYNRHGVGVGTGTGMNLYKAVDEHFTDTTIQIRISPDDMDPYKSYYSLNEDGEKEYHEISTEYVLSNVMSGIRFPGTSTGYGASSSVMKWTARVDTKLFGKMSGQINNIFRNIEKKSTEVGSRYISERVIKRMLG